jgi:glucosamine--fructose-6-phosphate aminotransferase (isomerizing)
MCGVFGYIGSNKEKLSDFLLEGLFKLEYRGYDSSGVAVSTKRGFKIIKEVGELKNLGDAIKDVVLEGSMGIGHTRWATHGKVSKRNSHPQTGCRRDLIVVHNGIIENFQELKNKLEKKGHKFTSDTDTEVAVHLVEQRIEKGETFKTAVRNTFRELDGLNAIVVLSKEGEMAAFRNGSPLVVGKTDNGYLVSSDIPALSKYTDKVLLLEDNQGVILQEDSLELMDTEGKSVKPKFKTISMDEVKADKGGYKHYLLKEIFEQPEVIRRVADNNKDDIRAATKMIKGAWGTYFTACGTAAHAGLTATYLFSEIAKRHVNFAYGSEFPFIEDFMEKRSLLIAASQSGETMDTLEAVKSAKKHNSKVLALVNVPGSSLTRLADNTIYLKAGPERAVLSTKSYIAKLSMFLLFACEMAGEYKKGKKILIETSNELRKTLSKRYTTEVKRLSKKLIKHEHIYIIGRGVNYPAALEGALKIKEASYVHAEGFAAGELKHGVIALIEKGTPCIAIVANDRAKDATISNAAELKARGGYVIGVACEDNQVFDEWLKVPDVKWASPILNIVPFQLLAYYMTVFRGYNPDKPRNLAKSVTVK